MQRGGATGSPEGRDNALMTRPNLCIAVLALVGSACSPALDWREFVPQGSGLSVAFPCRPDRHARAVPLAGRPVQMQMLVCAAGGSTFAVSFVDVADPAGISAALADLRATAVGNVQGREPTVTPFQLKGMAANAQAVRVSVAGHLPNGAAVREHAAFFARGLRVYQATVIGAAPGEPEVDAFFAGLKFPA